ncbi:hypothetical protein NOK12_22670 [Nocardioides sp. OK12]|uniref:hypothetical protein n=1 Tax=Nocardioides sp. OK12 TaxID=2758661 RepID=UPI0021C3CD05|nr:hypothetical protein [Nocardioides sp. OK12]GHJ59749.1 hypothetical protein NOK12_22670 [Nocardioides sp. OK12]
MRVARAVGTLCLGAALVVAVLGPLRPAPATARADAPCAAVVVGESGTWTRRLVPDFPVGPRQALSHAVERTVPSRQLLTNGQAVLRSTDGCAWQEVWRLPDAPTADLPVSAEHDRVLQVLQHPVDPRRVWLVVAVGQGIAERVDAGLLLTPAAAEQRDGTSTVVLRSTDGGETWAQDAAPPMPGAPGVLRASPTHPDLLLVPTASGLYRSHDGGRSWTLVPAALLLPGGGTRPLDGIASPVLVDVAVDPRTPQVLHGRTSVPVVSQDAGLTWRRVVDEVGAFTGPFLSDAPGQEPDLLVARQVDTTSPVEELLLGDRLATRAPVGPDALGGVPWRAAWTSAGVVVSTWDRGNAAAFPDTGLYLAGRDGSLLDIDDLALPWVRGVQADSVDAVHLHTRGELLTLSPTSGPTPAGQVDLDPFDTGTPAPPAPAELRTPARLEAPTGEQVDLDALLALPARPLPLDVYFLVDTSNSFEPDIDAVAESLGDLVDRLTRAGVDLRAGVGELGTREGSRYRRHADLARPGPSLVRGFEALRTGGGDEAHLVALHQTATGAGLVGTTGPSVPAGQAPTWRRGALRTVVVVTDTAFMDEGDPDAPERAAVYDAFARQDVRVVGLEVVRETGDDGVPGRYAGVEAADAAGRTFDTPARRDFEDVAAATAALAPAGGVDCRGNGTTEIAEGDPLVCTTTALHLADLSTVAAALRRVLLAQATPQEVTLRVRGDVRVVQQAPAAWTWPGIDVRRGHRLPARGTVTCPDEPGRHLLRLSAAVAGTRVASARTLLTCGSTGGPPVAAGAPAPDPVPAADGVPVGTAPTGPAPAPALPPPALAPAAPAPVGGAAPAVGTAAAPAPAGAAAPGTLAAPAAGAEQADSPELARAGAQAGAQEDEAAPLLLGAGLLTAAAAVGARRRQQSFQHSPQISGRPFRTRTRRTPR